MTHSVGETVGHNLSSERLAGFIASLLPVQLHLEDHTLVPDDALKVAEIIDDLRSVIMARDDFDLSQIAPPEPKPYVEPPKPEPTGARTIVDVPAGIAPHLPGQR